MCHAQLRCNNFDLGPWADRRPTVRIFLLVTLAALVLASPAGAVMLFHTIEFGGSPAACDPVEPCEFAIFGVAFEPEFDRRDPTSPKVVPQGLHGNVVHFSTALTFDNGTLSKVRKSRRDGRHDSRRCHATIPKLGARGSGTGFLVPSDQALL